MPPPVTPLVEEPIAMGGVYALRIPDEIGIADQTGSNRRSKTVFTAAHDAIG
jgi:hypothetical protein